MCDLRIKGAHEMRIALAQIDCRIGDWNANCHAMAREAGRAAEAKCDVVVFPELADLGTGMTAILERACPVGKGPWETLTGVARELGVHVIAGLSERDGDRVFNTTGVFSPTGGLIAKYRKIHLFSADPVREHEHLAAGDELVMVSIGGVRCGLMTCYDLRFPEMARVLALRGADLLIVPAAWPFPRLSHWKTLTAARAIENQLYLAAVNRVGVDGPQTYCGGSALLDPYGIPAATASEIDPALLIAEVTLDAIHETRGRMTVFDDRRPDIYAALSTAKTEPSAAGG